MDAAFSRRQGLALALAVAGLGGAALPALALPPRVLRFPRDFGSHPELRTEWWYITGHARARDGREFGFQVTFFRSRVDATQGMASAFAARQLVFAHAALSYPATRRLRHDQRIARVGFGIAHALEHDTDLRLRDWTLARREGLYRARLRAEGFELALDFQPTQPVLLQGRDGLSRKGPQEAQASYYYSEPQLAVRGRIGIDGQMLDIAEGRAWLDHEWSEALMHPEAVGWDWTGMNLDDGAALTAFRLRRADGSTLWTGGSWRGPGGTPEAFGPDGVHFEPLAHWTSPHTEARYPVRWGLRTPVGTFELRPLFEDQELDSRGSTGAVYWEGLSDLLDAQGRRVGRGYLEMTGYAQRLRL